MSVTITQERDSVRVEAPEYAWEWSASDDSVRLLDALGRTVTFGTHQPAILVARDGQEGPATPGRPALWDVTGDHVTIDYDHVNGAAHLRLTWRFDQHGAWLAPMDYVTNAADDIIRVIYFASVSDGKPEPSLFSSHHVVPGLSMNASISPIIPSDAHVRLTVGLGRGAGGLAGVHQQWGLPSHYFCGYHRNDRLGRAHSLTKTLSASFCCGLTELPTGDFWLGIDGGQASPIVNIRGDLWRHCTGPGTFSLGAGMVFTVGTTYHDAIRNYYRALLANGIIRPLDATTTAHKSEVMLSPQFNTWGAQMAAGIRPETFDENDLTTIYQAFRDSGMDARMFVIDDKWEGQYGALAHDEERFPSFLEMLARIRADGYLVGLWAAFMRCEDPALLGLTTDHMLRRPDGAPFMIDNGLSRYYVFDFTQPEVERALRASAQRFVRTYRPDMVKFDFGYEIPSLDVTAPNDLAWAGEQLLKKGLEVIVGAMKEVNPDLVVMYYGLSPLLIDYYDLHSVDDMCFNTGGYQLEANRRILFSGLCGEFGMPTYGSSGYDWVSSPSIWFDSAATGAVGSLNSCGPDENGDVAGPEWIAKYNGVTHALRPTCSFIIEPLDADFTSAALGATAGSWVRHEHDKVTLVALRTCWLNRGDGIASYGDRIAADVDVIVASKDDQDIGYARQLAIVPFGTGEIRLTTLITDVSSAKVTEHGVDGSTHTFRRRVTDGRYAVPLREWGDSGQPVEWLEVELHEE